MTDLHTTEVPVTSLNTPQYKSVAPSVFFGLIGAFFQARNARKRGLTDTGRYWKAAWISTAVGFVVGVIAIIMMAVMAIAVFKSAGTAVNTTPSQPAVSQTEVTPPVSQVIPPAVQIGPKADVTPKDMAMQLATIRRDAFCKGGTTGVNLLNQFWAYQSDPQPLGYTLEAASNLNELAPAAPHSTYAEDLRQLSTVKAPAANCDTAPNYAPRPDDLKVALSYNYGPATRVVATTFVYKGRLYDGYTAVYVLKNGRWYVDQMH